VENIFEESEWAILNGVAAARCAVSSPDTPPTGRGFTLHGCGFFHIIDGIRSQRGYWDKATWFKQLGCPLIESP
jgi:hypothetical protein